jgi:serine/threonine protein kinase
MSKICLMCGDTFADSTTFCPKDGSALRAAVHGDDLIGEVFCERYVVTDLLGEGGMGSVYVARDVRLPQQVAIKVLRDKTAIDPITVSRFRQEAEAASRINHDRVARVSDFGFMNDGRAYIIMEYVSGRTLKQTIDERGPLPPVEVAQITSMVAEGLDAAHRLGIVHRDLKPENVMIVDDAGGGTRVKVLDFGIAKVLQGDESGGRTAPGFVIGTPQWMSPEQILGETLDARSDVFALGLLAYAMLTAQRAYGGTSEQAEMMARLTSMPRALTDVMPGTVWPVGLQELLNRTLSRDVNLRPAGALAFARELTKTVEEGTRTPTPVVVARTDPPQSQSRNLTRVGIGAGAVLAVALIAGVVWRTSSSGTKTDAGKLPAAGDSAKQPPVVATAAPVAGEVPAAVVPHVDTLPSKALAPPTAPATSGAQPTTPQSAATSLVIAPPKQVGTRTRAPVTPPVDADPKSAPKGVAETASPHDQLQRLMDDADADIGGTDNNAKRSSARELLRKLDDLSPKLVSPTDQGWALLYTGTSQATMGDNDKACSSIKRARSLADKSAALRNSADRWQETLNCGK